MSVQNFYDNRISQVIDREMADLLEEIPEQITLSWFVEKLISSAKESREGDHEGQITLNIEHDGRWLHISMDKDEGKDKYRCAYRIDARKEDNGQYKIYAAKIDDDSIGSSKIVGPFYNFEKILMHVYALKGSIVADKGFDPEDYDTGWCND
jgi:hypothetical protein